MKTFCESLKKHTMEILNFEKKKKKSLTDKWRESYDSPEYYNIRRKQT